MAERQRVGFLRGSSPRRVISSENTEPSLVVEDLENVLAWVGGDIVVPSPKNDLGELGEDMVVRGDRTRREHVIYVVSGDGRSVCPL